MCKFKALKEGKNNNASYLAQGNLTFDRNCPEYLPKDVPKGDVIVVGYPFEDTKKFFLYQNKAALKRIEAREGGKYGVIYHCADTTGGQSGSPIYQERADGEVNLIGVHTGFCKVTKLNVGTLLTPEIWKWINETIRNN